MGFFDIFRTHEVKNTAIRSDPIDTTIQSTDPLISQPVNIIGGQLADYKNTRGNRYALADSLYASDERLYSTIELMAVMIAKSIGDVSITGIKNDDSKLSPEEQNAIKVANKFAKDINIKKLFYRYTIDLWKYGDAVDIIKIGYGGITDLIPLPMQHVTAVENRDQINKNYVLSGKIIQNANYYIVNELQQTVDVKPQVFRKDRIFHVSFNPDRSMVRDNQGRWTFGVWSTSPINSLIPILQWKQNLIRNDMLWSNRAVPREDHKLDLSQFSIDKFPGTYEQKKAASIAAAKAAIQEYSDNMARREADQGFVHGTSVEITYVEPSTTNWQDPSGKIDQINSLIGGPMGAPGALVGGESKGYTSIVHSSSFFAMRAEVYAKVIQDKIEELMKRHIRIVRPGIRKSVVDRLYIKTRLILDRDRAELAKIVAALAPTNVLTVNDLRAVFGLDPITDEELNGIFDFVEKINELKKQGSGGNLTSVQEDLLRKNQNSPTGGQESSQKRTNDRFQIGNDKGSK